MDLVQARFVTDDVDALAAFYARVLRRHVPRSDYYTEVTTAVASVAFSRSRFTEPDARGGGCGLAVPDGVILDFHADDVDTEYERLRSFGLDWVMPPTDQPWGKRSMMFRDPDGHIVNVFAEITA
jgi:uncharacterized glyoxalase superfamily protein PhnB